MVARFAKPDAQRNGGSGIVAAGVLVCLFLFRKQLVLEYGLACVAFTYAGRALRGYRHKAELVSVHSVVERESANLRTAVLVVRPSAEMAAVRFSVIGSANRTDSARNQTADGAFFFNARFNLGHKVGVARRFNHVASGDKLGVNFTRLCLFFQVRNQLRGVNSRDLVIGNTVVVFYLRISNKNHFN